MRRTRGATAALTVTPLGAAGTVTGSRHLVDVEDGRLLVADKDATLEMVTEIVDAVKGGGVKKVAFSIQKK